MNIVVVLEMQNQSYIRQKKKLRKNDAQTDSTTLI
jgi:hypothetical protein